MKARSLTRSFSEALKSIFRNKLMSLSSIITVSACIFIVILTYCIAVNLDSILGGIESDVQITVYIDDALNADELNVLYLAVRNYEHVTSVQFVSADESLQMWLANKGMDSDTYKMLERNNPLRRSFIVTIDNGANVVSSVEWLKSDEMSGVGIAKVNHDAAIIETILSFNNVVRVICLVIIAALALLSVVIITNTIKLTINSRRNEISIMKYIGSTNWFIRWPFVSEGFLLGLVGSVIPLAAFVIFYDSVIEFIMINFQFLASIINFQQGSEIFPLLIPAVLILGSAIGTLASLTTIRKFLDV